MATKTQHNINIIYLLATRPRYRCQQNVYIVLYISCKVTKTILNLSLCVYKNEEIIKHSKLQEYVRHLKVRRVQHLLQADNFIFTRLAYQR